MTAKITLNSENKLFPYDQEQDKDTHSNHFYSTYWKSQPEQLGNKKIKKASKSERKMKNYLFVGNMILYIENSKHSSKKLLELINEFSKMTGHKINIQQSVAFLYANNELTEK